jgi:hypothetical protein
MRAVLLTPRRKLALYLGITFFLSWSIGLTFWFAGGEWGSPASQAVVFLFMIPPGFAALAVKGAIAKEPVTADLGLRLTLNRWWLVAWLTPVVVALIATGLGSLMPGAVLDASVQGFLARFPNADPSFAEAVQSFHDETGLPPIARMVPQALVAGITLNAVRGLGEELGWRGLMHHELSLPFWREATVVGVVWGVWYIPLLAQGHWYPGVHPVVAVPIGIAWCVVASAVFLEIRRCSRTVYAPAILYGTFESIGHLPWLTEGPSAAWVGLHGVAGIAALALVLGALIALRRPRTPTEP